jgi:hypothetical protein
MNTLLKQHLQIGGSAGRIVACRRLSRFRLSLDTRPGAPPELAVAGTNTYRREFKTIAAGPLLNYVDTLINRLPNMARVPAYRSETF